MRNIEQCTAVAAAQKRKGNYIKTIIKCLSEAVPGRLIFPFIIIFMFPCKEALEHLIHAFFNFFSVMDM